MTSPDSLSRVLEHRVPLAETADASDCTPELAGFARGFLVAGRSYARFLWRSQSRWFAISLRREPGDDTHGVVAVVTQSNAKLPRGITEREAEVLTLIALGLTNAEIAGRLGTRPRTVSTQVERLLQKLSQGSRAGLAAMAVDAGLIVLPIPGGTVNNTSIVQAEIHQAAKSLAPQSLQVTNDEIGYTDHKPIRIGAIAPLIGPGASDGLELVRGASIAIRDLNARGGVDGRPVQHVVQKVDILDEASVTTAVEKLIEEGVDAIHTNYVTAESPSALEVIADYGKPFLHTATLKAHVELVRRRPDRFGMIFQTCPHEHFYQDAFVDLIGSLEEKKLFPSRTRTVLALEADSPSSDVANHELAQRLKKIGWTLGQTLRIPIADPDWSAIVETVIAATPDALFISHFLPEVSELQRELSRRGFQGLTFFVYAASIRSFQENIGAAAEGILWATVTGRYDDPMGERFQREFTLRYGEAPGASQASAAYDQVMLLANAWTSAGSTQADRTIHELRSGITRGLNGVYYLGDPGQAALCYPYETEDSSLGQALFVYQVQNGQPVALAPAPKGDLRRFHWPPH